MLGSKFVKLLISILKWKVNSSSDFALFFIVMTHNSVNFKTKVHFLLSAKGPHQGLNFDIFKCSCKNLPNLSCYFSNDKSVFLQILHHSSVPWKITPLYFSSSNSIYLCFLAQTVKQQSPFTIIVIGARDTKKKVITKCKN